MIVMHRRRFLALLLALLAFAASTFAASPAVEAIASLADPVKLATLGERGANPRVQKITYWLVAARSDGENPEAVIDTAFARFGWKGTAKGELTKAAMIRNVSIAEKLGCLDAAGLADMRRGQSPTIRNGPYAGDQLSVDHIIPRALVPELDNVLANLELMPLRMNQRKGKAIGARQLDTARKFVEVGLMSAEAVARVK